MKTIFAGLCVGLTLVLVACGGSASQILPPSLTSSPSMAGIYEGTLTTAQENGTETSLLIEEDNSFSLVTDSGLQLLGTLTRLNDLQYQGTAVLSHAEDASLPMLSVSLSMTVNANRSISASFSGSALGSFTVLPSVEPSTASAPVSLSLLAGQYAAVPRSISTRLATQWTLSNTGSLTGSDAVSSYIGTATQPRADKNPFVLVFTRQLNGPSIPSASFEGRLWYLPAKGARPTRLVMASRRITEGHRGIAGIFAKQ